MLNNTNRKPSPKNPGYNKNDDIFLRRMEPSNGQTKLTNKNPQQSECIIRVNMGHLKN